MTAGLKMSLNLVKDLKAAYSNLSADVVRRTAEEHLVIGLVAPSEDAYDRMRYFLRPPTEGSISARIFRADDSERPANFHLVLYDSAMPCPENAFVFYAADQQRTIREVLDRKSELDLPLARNFEVFREPVIDDIIQRVSKENALFTVASALPNVIPSVLELPWAVGEFATDTAFLTMNQIRMALLMAGACGDPVGYLEQKEQIGLIIGGAFGWRAIARELAGKIPLGGGLIPKGAISFAGTYAVGAALKRYHLSGIKLTLAERRATYLAALEKGREVVSAWIDGLKRRRVT
jgi:hypothetical protein